MDIRRDGRTDGRPAWIDRQCVESIVMTYVKTLLMNVSITEIPNFLSREHMLLECVQKLTV